MNLTGQTIAGCEIISELGHGGMGAVYKARQSALKRLVAVKVMARDLAEDKDFVTRFKREAAVAAQLHHQNMVLVHSAGEENGLCYIVMEFVEGRSLQEHITRHGVLNMREALAITINVALALQYAWNKSRLIHRDIKPANIFLSNEGEVKVGDLGLAKNVGQSTGSLTQTGTTMGSPLYIAPEQAQGIKEIDFRADIYSLGCTMYHMLIGRPPYEGTDAVSIIHKHIYDPPPAIFKAMPACPMRLGMLVGKMLAKKPADRHQSYEELIADLYVVTEKIEVASVQPTTALPQPAADAAATVPSPTPVKPPPQARAATPVLATPVLAKKKSPVMIYGIVGAATVVLLAGLFLWSPWSKPSPQDSKTPSFQHSAFSSAAALKLLGNVFTNSVSAEMVYIPPGEFMLGSTKEEQAWAVTAGAKQEDVKREGEAPRKATIKQGFWMGRTEVTVGQWKQFVKETDYVTDGERKGESGVYQYQAGVARYGQMKGKSWRDPNFGSEPQDNHPVSCISWNDAVAFCRWLTEHEQKAGRMLAGYMVRLPTEAEWEYACRAGTQAKFWWGDSEDDSTGRLNGAAKEDGFEWVAPVDSYGSRGRNAFGLADMLGNVGEWCLDGFDAKQAHEEYLYYQSGRNARATRGGAFCDRGTRWRCACRSIHDPSSSISAAGFRIVVGVDVSGARTSTPSTQPATATGEGGILAPAETRVSALTTNPKVGEVFTLPVGGNVTMELMGIPPGEFMLGSTQEEQTWGKANASAFAVQWINSEGKVPRKTTIRQGFWIGRTEVTVGQWKRFIGATGYQTTAEKTGQALAPQGGGKPWGTVKGANWQNPNFGFKPEDNHPVCCISWKDAVAFCEWLTEQERKAGSLPAGFRIRLPTEAEWEYACRAGTRTMFWWGDSPADGQGRLNMQGKQDGFEFASPVDYYGARGRNGFGLADMLGNMKEWCLDTFDPDNAHEEVFTSSSDKRVNRASGFTDSIGGTRCAARGGDNSGVAGAVCGFRVVVGTDVSGARTSTPSTQPATATGKGGILAPAETRVSVLTTAPKVGEVFTLP